MTLTRKMLFLEFLDQVSIITLEGCGTFKRLGLQGEPLPIRGMSQRGLWDPGAFPSFLFSVLR